MTHSGPVVAEGEDWQVIDCETCGFRHLQPYPDREALERFYTDSFYTDFSADYIAKHQEDREWWELEYTEKFELFDSLLAADMPRSVLDIGSGPGFFLRRGRELGWQTRGVEPGKAAWRFSSETLGLDVFNGFFDREQAPGLGRFAVIHMNNVLEHIVNPRELLELATADLLPGGLVCVTVPNDFNPLQRVAQSQLELPPWWVAPTQHMNYFDAASLSRLFLACGLTPIHQTGSFPMELFLLMGDDYVSEPALGRQMHGKRKLLERHLHAAGAEDLKRKLYDALADLGLGRHITLLGRLGHD